MECSMPAGVPSARGERATREETQVKKRQKTREETGETLVYIIDFQ